MKWKRYERSKSKAHKGAHVGGPGKPDYVRGKVKGEIKHRKTPVTRPELIKICRNGVTEVESLNGFTRNALEYRDRYRPNVRLLRKGRRQ
jgi:hypothetical protein